MKESIIVLIFTLLYIVVTYGLVAIFNRRDRIKAGRNISKEEFTSAAGSLSLVATIGLVIGNIVTSDYTVGLVQSIYANGANSLITFICWQITNILFGIFFVPLYRAMLYKYNSTTITSAMSNMFDSRVAKLVAIVTAVAFIATFAGGPLAIAALVAPMTGISYDIVYWASVVLFVALTLMGGLKGIARANVLHACMIFVSMVTLFILCMKNVSVPEMMQALPVEITNPWNISTSDLIGIFITQSCCGFCSALLGTAAMGAKKTSHAKFSMITLASYIIIYIIMVCFIAFTAKYAIPGVESSSAFYEICHKFGPYMTAFGAVATFAAVFSSAPTLLLVGCNGLVEELYANRKGTEVSEQKTLRVTKLLIVIVGFAMPLLTKNAPTILTVTSNGWTIMGVLGTVLVLSCIWKKPDTNSTFYGMLVGSGICIVWVFAYYITGHYPFDISAAYAGMIPGLAVTAVMTLLTCKKRVSDEWERIVEAKHEMEAAIKSGDFQ